jgi:hypothetical protein
MPSLNYFDKDTQQWVAIPLGGAADLTDYAKTEDLPIVYEQAGEPVGKDGDLWLKPTVATDGSPANNERLPITSQEVEELKEKVRYLSEDFLLDPSNAVTAEFKQVVFDAVKVMLNGGKMPPPDMPWTACQQVAGAGNVEARVINGMIQLRGNIAITTTGWTLVRKLPALFPKPTGEYPTVVTGGESKVAERVCQAVIKANREIYINPFGNKITDINLYPASAPVV